MNWMKVRVTLWILAIADAIIWGIAFIIWRYAHADLTGPQANIELLKTPLLLLPLILLALILCSIRYIQWRYPN